MGGEKEHKKQMAETTAKPGRKTFNGATITESVAQGSDYTVREGAAPTRTDTLWAPNPLFIETEGGQ